jgi:uncharacterized small protein (DUF1192 family)
MNDDQYTVESLSDRIGMLVAERQRLRAENAPADVLEHNRLAIAEAQQVLSELLIKRHRPSAAA